MKEMPKIVPVIIESPKGGTQKYDYDPKSGYFKLNKILPAGMAFPFDFGFIPGTKGEDGDPLDVIVISEARGIQGSMVDCRIIGAIKAEQTERDGATMRNDRFLGIPQVSQLFSKVNSLKDLPENILRQLEVFFKNYNEQADKRFKVLKRLPAGPAGKLIK
jgi:inorganic pyrophosphatase